ncbi:ABC transporter ATP-binding protein [Bartonella sp. HY761]|uniref:ABC transporter ATP-binding protein n=1 Tax=Bartonella sp. HY761 TaxID=2979330 RepID=UPI0022083C9F|nr:ABC transporter ATP-binding protein [Bartonella sp. HY761]UXN05858.1 ABC transporter ATP-binding protein [Bartonella sp. HY761]
MSEIIFEQISRQWGGVGGVDNVSFSVEKGDFLVLLGPSGCGKSTTLRLLAGLETSDSGKIFIAGRDVTHLPPKDRKLSMVFQSYALFPHLNVAENIVYGLKVRGVGRAERDERLKKVAQIVGLSHLLDRKSGQLSGGQKQRVALGRAIIAEAAVCLMDEPLSNLDAKLRHEMRTEIRSLQQRLGMTMVYVTHDQTEAMTMADQVVLMNNGKIEQKGAPHELYQCPTSTFAARFVGMPPMNLIEYENHIIGIRPEDARIDTNNGPLKGSVKSVEYLGADSIIVADIAGQTVLVREAGFSNVKPQSEVYITWDSEAAHHFNLQTGMRQ